MFWPCLEPSISLNYFPYHSKYQILNYHVDFIRQKLSKSLREFQAKINDCRTGAKDKCLSITSGKHMWNCENVFEREETYDEHEESTGQRRVRVEEL